MKTSFYKPHQPILKDNKQWNAYDKEGIYIYTFWSAGNEKTAYKTAKTYHPKTKKVELKEINKN